MACCVVCKNTKVLKKYHKSGWIYYLCKKCSALFLSPLPGQDFLEKTYTNFSYNDGFAQEVELRSNARSIITQCAQITKAQTLLDIGAGAGFLLHEAQILGLSVFGIEPSTQLAAYGKNTFGLPIYCSRLTLAAVKALPHKFDIVVLSHVIEHIYNPVDFLNLAFSCLSTNGVLVIETPNLDSWLYSAEGENYTFLTPPEHVCLYSKKTLCILLKNLNTPASIIRIHTFSHPSHCKGVIQPFIGTHRTTTRKRTFWKQILHLLVDHAMAHTLTPFINFGNKGSILRLYLRKI